MNNRAAGALIGALIVVPLAGSSQEPEGPLGAEPDLREIEVPTQRVYFDPETGRLTNKPPPGAVPFALGPEELNAISTSQVGLVQRAAPGGGTMIDLQGRFQTMSVATMAPDGSVRIHEVAGGLVEEKPEDTEVNQED